MNRDIADILDRFSIAQLKMERIGTDDNKKECEAFKSAFEKINNVYPQYDWQQFFNFIKDINSAIWFLEAQMKGEKDLLPQSACLDHEENEKVLIQIGKNSILIRNINGFRVSFKNIINKLTNTGFIDIKKDHLSA